MEQWQIQGLAGQFVNARCFSIGRSAINVVVVECHVNTRRNLDQTLKRRHLQPILM